MSDTSLSYTKIRMLCERKQIEKMVRRIKFNESKGRRSMCHSGDLSFMSKIGISPCYILDTLIDGDYIYQTEDREGFCFTEKFMEDFEEGE